MEYLRRKPEDSQHPSCSEQNRLSADSGIGLALLRYCSGDGDGGGGINDGGGGSSFSLEAQQSFDCCSPCRRRDCGTCCFCNDCCVPAPSSPAPCRSASLGSYLDLLGSRCCCWGKIASLFSSLSPPLCSSPTHLSLYSTSPRGARASIGRDAETG